MQAKFEPESVVTEADRANDVRSLRRNTQGWLYLAVKNNLDRSDGHWQLPVVPVGPEDGSIRAAAQRWLAEMFGNSAEAFIVGNVPAAVLASNEAQTFYMLGVMLDGMPEMQSSASVHDFAWLTLAELQEAYQSKDDAQQMLRTVLVNR